jgi:uncharacterized protein YggE
VRLVALGLALALGAAWSAPAAAQVSLPPLAPGEVLVQTSTLGQIVSAPDRATLSALVSAQGPNQEVARQAARARLARVNAALAAAGIAPADIQSSEVSIGLNYAELPTELIVVAAAAGGFHGNDAGGPTATATLRITIRDLGRLAAVREALEANEVTMAAPDYALADESAARNAARAQAMQKARAEAELYAASLNMRVARVLRISERIGLEGLNLLLTDTRAFNRLFTRMWRPSSQVETMVAVGVDFALAPR